MTDTSNPEYRAEVKRLIAAGYTKAHSEQAARRILGIPEPSPVVAVQQQLSTTAVKTPASKAPASNAEIRAWAKEQGIDVPARGRIPASVVKRYTDRR
ncbi:MAG TPA: histone-like nucleoid-structuring protein Lsr2 [Streptosporangiaceae bacterium]|jgi:hypothetical protein|nr:histone-like nucleoid-structuring protein Lsr2 [Streptosporangiaceae bacterium]